MKDVEASLDARDEKSWLLLERMKMVEKGTIKVKEADRPEPDYYELVLKDVKQRNDKAAKGVKLVRGKDNPWTFSRQGYIKRYANIKRVENSLSNLVLFVHEIRTHSGRHKHQGGYNLFVLKGKGYTVVDGVRNDWQEGDLIQLAFKPGGVEHQHFNGDDRPSRWLALNCLPFADMVGAFLEQKENHPDWKGSQQA